MKFKRKQVEVQAVQFVDGRYGEAIDFCPQLDVRFAFASAGRNEPMGRAIDAASIGQLTVTSGDWIVKEENGSFGVCDNATFEKEFEAV
jgi:hypothetical protein